MKMSNTQRLNGLAALLVIGSFGLSACASMNKKQEGAVIGAAAGGAIGGVIGNQTGSTARGAIIGAVVGGAAGAIIGHQMDQQAKELSQSIPGATVARVGEGIAVTFESGILFAFDSDQILPTAGTNLSELAKSLQRYPDSQLLIVGHTDAKGDDAYNQRLSERRSASAAAYLASQGVDRARLSATGKGESEPIAANDTDAGQAKNRRVEVAIFASEAYRQRLLRSNTGD